MHELRGPAAGARGEVGRAPAGRPRARGWRRPARPRRRSPRRPRRRRRPSRPATSARSRARRSGDSVPGSGAVTVIAPAGAPADCSRARAAGTDDPGLGPRRPRRPADARPTATSRRAAQGRPPLPGQGTGLVAPADPAGRRRRDHAGAVPAARRGPTGWSTCSARRTSAPTGSRGCAGPEARATSTCCAAARGTPPTPRTPSSCPARPRRPPRCCRLQRAGVVVVPFGGGTSVVGGLAGVDPDDRPSIAVDLWPDGVGAGRSTCRRPWSPSARACAARPWRRRSAARG